MQLLHERMEQRDVAQRVAVTVQKLFGGEVLRKSLKVMTRDFSGVCCFPQLSQLLVEILLKQSHTFTLSQPTAGYKHSVPITTYKGN